ncbi:MAG: hypothetical protein WBX38_14050 [Candidatus Sulfotelmatobacter sp.]
MHKMGDIRRQAALVFALISGCAVLWLGQGCVREDSLNGSDASSAASSQKLPFHAGQPTAGHTEPEAAALSLASSDAKKAPAPFQPMPYSVVLPSGTLLTVQLENTLTARKVHEGDAFKAKLAAPFTIGGHVALDLGTLLTGRVEAARVESAEASRMVDTKTVGPGYFRLTLTAITIAGKQVALQTSSLFTRATGISPDNLPMDAKVLKGRRLTFRLMAPAALNGLESTAERLQIVPTSE